MTHLPSNDCISIFKDRIFVYHKYPVGKGITIYTIKDGIITFQIAFFSEYMRKRNNLTRQLLIQKRSDNNSFIRHFHDNRFWMLSCNKSVDIFRLTDEELLLEFTDEL